MNLVWSAVMLVGMGLLVINNVDLVVNSLLNGGSKAITLSLKLWGIYTLWLGILKIVEETGLDKKLSKLLSPIIKWIFGEVDDYTKNQNEILKIEFSNNKKQLSKKINSNNLSYFSAYRIMPSL